MNLKQFFISIFCFLTASAGYAQMPGTILLQAGTHGMITVIQDIPLKENGNAKDILPGTEVSVLTDIVFGDRSTSVYLQGGKVLSLTDPNFNYRNPYCLLSDANIKNYDPIAGQNAPILKGRTFRVASDVGAPTRQRADLTLIDRSNQAIFLECSDREPLINRIADKVPFVGYHDNSFYLKMSTLKKTVKGILYFQE